MAIDKHDPVIRKLKQEVKRLQQREEKAKREVKAAFKKARKLSMTYKSKLEKEARAMKHKIALEFARLVKCFLHAGMKGKKRGKR